MIKAKNEGGEQIESVSFVVLFYKGDQLVDVQRTYLSGALEPGAEATAEASIPYTSDYRNSINFDSFEVMVDSAL